MRTDALPHAPPTARPRSVWSAWLFGPLLAPFALALLLRLGLALAVPVEPVWDGVIYDRVATSLAEGHGYTHAAIAPGQSDGATSFYPVGFPAALAPLRMLRAARAADLVVQAVAGALAALGAGVLGRRIGGKRVGVLAAWLVALWPGGVLLSASWLSEPFFGLFVLAATLVVAYARRARTVRATALAALALALGAYVRPTAIPMLLAVVVGLVWVHRPQGRRATMVALARHLAVAGIALAVVVAPWAMRNAASLDGPALISTNGGANLLVGAMGEGTFARLPDDAECPDARGEVARDRCHAAMARARIAADPMSWLARGVLKLTHTFGHESSPAQAWAEATERAGVRGEAHALWALAIDRAFWLPFLAASLAGAVLLSRRARAAKVALFAPIVALAALHFVFLGGDRYHAPVVPHMAVLAAIAITAARRRRTA